MTIEYFESLTSVEELRAWCIRLLERNHALQLGLARYGQHSQSCESHVAETRNYCNCGFHSVRIDAQRRDAAKEVSE